ncbi:FAD-dependent monooxygenase [Streptomyces sp. NPDC048637]|uniref:FAD-dependent monooxygenase n=1 Tax=Streptomyces sp. NPDC048637 TaxID=3155636 RepID=UPI00342C41BD
MCFVRNEQVYATLLSKNGRDQWSSHIMDYPGKPDGLTGLSEDKTLELLRAAIGDEAIPIELHAVNAWEAAIGMAASFRQGRVFLAGDAAHVQSSAGGLGMNTGIQDGHNLAWKTAAVLHEQFTPALLDTYEPERRAAARASLALSRHMHPTLDLAGSRWTLFVEPGDGRWQATAASLGIEPHVHDLNTLGDAVLVRPDGFVAWRGATRESLQDALRDLGLRPQWPYQLVRSTTASQCGSSGAG